MRLYRTTHETDWRRVQWVHDEDYETRGSYAYDTEALTKAAEDHEIEGLNNGTLVVLGAIVELRCPHCKYWVDKDALWGIVVKVGEDLEDYGTECLDIPDSPEHYDKECEEAPEFLPPPPEGPPNTLEKEGDTVPRVLPLVPLWGTGKRFGWAALAILLLAMWVVVLMVLWLGG